MLCLDSTGVDSRTIGPPQARELALQYLQKALNHYKRLLYLKNSFAYPISLNA